MIFPRPRHTDIPQAVACNANHPSWFTSHEEVRSPYPSHPIPSHPIPGPPITPPIPPTPRIAPDRNVNPYPYPSRPNHHLSPPPPPRLIDKRTHLSPKEPQTPSCQRTPLEAPNSTPSHLFLTPSRTPTASRTKPPRLGTPHDADGRGCLERAQETLPQQVKKLKCPPREESLGSASL